MYIRSPSLQICPEEYLTQFFKHNIRIDGRGAHEIRSVTINLSVLKHAYGSCVISSGGTRFLAGVTGEIGPPTIESPSAGRILVDVDFPKVCGAENIFGTNLQMLSVQASKSICQILSSREVLDLKQLCIAEGSAVWTLYINVICIEYDGNCLDWALAASVQALLSTELPSIVWSDKDLWWRVDCSLKCETNESDINSVQKKQIRSWFKRSIQFCSIPISLTVTRLFNKYYVVDPIALEDTIGSSITIWREGETGEIHFFRFNHCYSDEVETLNDIANIVAAITQEPNGHLRTLASVLENARCNAIETAGECVLVEETL